MTCRIHLVLTLYKPHWNTQIARMFNNLTVRVSIFHRNDLTWNNDSIQDHIHFLLKHTSMTKCCQQAGLFV